MSIALGHMHHAYAQTDETYTFPNSREGDILKQSKKEIEELEAQVTDLKFRLKCSRSEVASYSERALKAEAQLAICKSTHKRMVSRIIDCDRHKITGTEIGEHSGFWIDPDELQDILEDE